MDEAQSLDDIEMGQRFTLKDPCMTPLEVVYHCQFEGSSVLYHRMRKDRIVIIQIPSRYLRREGEKLIVDTKECEKERLIPFNLDFTEPTNKNYQTINQFLENAGL